MCQPSASSAMELNHQPALISTTIITAVIHITARVLRSAAGLPVSKTCSCCQGLRSRVCMEFLQEGTLSALRGKHHSCVIDSALSPPFTARGTNSAHEPMSAVPANSIPENGGEPKSELVTELRQFANERRMKRDALVAPGVEHLLLAFPG